MRADLAGHLPAVRRGRARARPRPPATASSWSRTGPRTQSPKGLPPRSCTLAAVVEVRQRRRPLRRRPAPRSGCRGARPGPGLGPGRARASRAATSVSTPPRSRSSARWRCTRSRAELGHQRRQPRVAGLAETAEGQPGESLTLGRATRPAEALRDGAVTTRADARARPAPAARPMRRRKAAPQLVDPGLCHPAEVGHRPGHPVHPGGPAAGEAAGVHLGVEQRRRRRGQRPLLPEHRPGRLPVEPPRKPGVPLMLQAPRLGHPGPDGRGRLGSAQGVLGLVLGHRSDPADDVDPVDHRARQLAAVVAPLHLQARASVGGGIGGEVAARTRVAGQHEHAARRIGRGLLAPGDRHLARLQRLPQRVEDVTGEEGELVEQEHAAVGPAQLPGPHLAGAAAEQAGA